MANYFKGNQLFPNSIYQSLESDHACKVKSTCGRTQATCLYCRRHPYPIKSHIKHGLNKDMYLPIETR